MLDVLIWAVTLPPLIGLTIYTAEVLAGLKALKRLTPQVHPTSLVVIVPAHNEQAGIGETVRLLQNALPSNWRTLVVADNCTDLTAEIARAAGAETIDRIDEDKRGKGFALARARDHLRSAPPEVVVVIDADCRIDSLSLQHLGASAYGLQSPVQAVNLLTASEHAPPIVQISNFAMLIKNLVRARGLYRIYGALPLFGTGMAFPWATFDNAHLATGDTVEDLTLAVELVERGISVHLDEHARVTSPSAAAADTIGQRRRWEHGFLRVAARTALPLLARALAKFSKRQLGLALHLCVPPLALLISISVVCLCFAAFAAVAANVRGPVEVLGLALAAALAATSAAWLREGRNTLSVAALTKAPSYVLSKLPIYMSLFTNYQSHWNRTRRDNED